jgi:signal transduction histidine kinase/DNA-binding response OmpR family regulator
MPFPGKVFNLIVLMTIPALSLAMISILFIPVVEHTGLMIIVLMLLLFLIAFWVVNHFRIFTVGINVLLLSASLIFYPAFFFNDNGYQAGMSVFPAAPLVLSFFVLKKKNLAIVVLLQSLAILVCNGLQLIHPDWVQYPLQDNNAIVGDILLNILIISFLIALIAKFQARLLENETRRAQAANRAKSQFLATMSHEIRTPMNAIIGISQIQLNQTDLPEEIQEAFRKIYTSGHGLLGIINDILDLSKIETGKLELISDSYHLPSLIYDTVQLNMIRIGSKPITFELQINPMLPETLIGDELRLKQILNNLLSNAFKYTDEGKVKLTVDYVQQGGSGQLVFKVADTGQGMSTEDLAQLFSDYSRFNIKANRTKEGTGLGMSITKKLLDLMNGTITVKSQYGIGSTFTVMIPQSDNGSDPIGKETAEKLCTFSFMGRKCDRNLRIHRELMPYGKVLIVDDVETNLFVAEGLMSPYQIQIEKVTSGYATLSLLEQGRTFDVIFMDHMMPGMDGLETTNRIRAMGYKGVVVALTANALSGNEEMFKKNGFTDYISKPIDLIQLDQILQKYVKNQHKEEAALLRAQRTSSQTISSPSTNKDTAVSPKLLEVFLRDAKKAVKTLSQTLEIGDWKLFTTTAHAMKAACANVNQTEMSALARELESAGKAENTVLLHEKTPVFLEKLQTFITQNQRGNVKSARAESVLTESALAESSTSEEDIAFLLKQLSAIAAACQSYDESTATQYLQELEKRSWSNDTQALLSAITEDLLHSDFDEAAGKCHIMIAHDHLI